MYTSNNLGFGPVIIEVYIISHHMFSYVSCHTDIIALLCSTIILG